MKEMLKKFLKRYSFLKMPYEINSGYCFEFAQILRDAFPTAEVFETTFDFGDDWPFHTYTKIRGKYYDAECLGGVETPEELPIFKRHRETHPSLTFKSTEIATGQ